MTKKKKVETATPSDSHDEQSVPLSIKIIGWFGICFSLTYLIWGTVSIILSMLDRTYADFTENIIIIFYGLPVLIISINFKKLQTWAWYGLLAVFVFIVIWTALTYRDIFGIILGCMALLALIGLFLPTIRKHYLTT